jgi:hypothetical protein
LRWFRKRGVHSSCPVGQIFFMFKIAHFGSFYLWWFLVQNRVPAMGSGLVGGQDALGSVLEPNSAQTMTVSLHELATNAAKYGALSVPDGRVGASERVMDAMIRGQLKGEMRFEWRAEGLACEITMPA